MKQMLFALILCLGSTSAALAENVSAALAAFEKERTALGVRSFALSLEDNLAAVKEGEALARERAFAEQWVGRLGAVDQGSPPVCERINLELALHEARMVKRRAELGATPRFKETLKSGLGASEEGRRFYDLLLDWQTGVDVTADGVFAFGQREIELAKRRRHAAAARIAIEEKRSASAAPSQSSLIETGDAAAIQKAFEAADRIVRGNVGKLFYSYDIPSVKIARAERGGPLANTPGFYDGASGTFFYNVPGETYDLRDRDWLHLHEAVPGHHFQNAIAALGGACRRASPDLWSPAYVEGWGAYVETLGRSLGLYEDPAAELAAADWNLVRSVRVAIDVGLNHRGWTDEEALTYWRSAIPDQDDLARREIDRMRRWPAQVVTYKLGAFWIARARDRLAAVQEKTFDDRAFHDLVLRHGPMPFPVFEALVDKAAADEPGGAADAKANRGGLR